jgi:ribosomal protein L11 methyltransferase
VLAFDANLLAVETARRNVHLNGLERRVTAVQARAEEMAGVPCDLLMANIHFDVMRQMLDHGALSGCTWFLLSGLLRSEARDIRHRLAALPVEILQSAQADGIWHTFLGRVI